MVLAEPCSSILHVPWDMLLLLQLFPVSLILALVAGDEYPDCNVPFSPRVNMLFFYLFIFLISIYGSSILQTSLLNLPIPDPGNNKLLQNYVSHDRKRMSFKFVIFSVTRCQFAL